jgi:hypothetical protein
VTLFVAGSAERLEIAQAFIAETDVRLVVNEKLFA